MSEAEITVFDPYWWALLVLGTSVALSITMHIPVAWRFRKVIAGVNTSLIGVSTGLLLVSIHPLFAGLAFIVQSFRLITVLRIVQNRLNAKALYARSLRSEAWLGGWLAAILIANYFVGEISVTLVLALCILQVVTAAVLYRHTENMKKKTLLLLPKKFVTTTDAPSVTIAIPARNQTSDLAECLQSVLRLTYPKLEVLVLDDCSQDKTSDIIRKFAHRGVRFLQGTPPSSSWIAKNHAYDQLLDNASGELILFCGTDVRFEPQSLTLLVEAFVSGERSMMSILPLRNQRYDRHFLLQPMRYYRELVFPSKSLPALSTCWIAKRKMLKKHGGFDALRKSIRPEKIIAKGVSLKGNYTFVAASSGLGISSQKDLQAQWRTAYRTRYPELRNRPESVLYTLLWQLFVFVGPFMTLLYGLFTVELLIIFLSSVAIGYLFTIHLLVNRIATGKSQLYSLLIYPTSIILELAVTVYSMWAYEFSEVIWKGRNVCLPVLQTNLRLPKLS